MSKDVLLRALGRVPVPLGLYRRLLRTGAFGLAYHIVSDESQPHVRHIFPYKSARGFAADLRWLKRRCRPLSYDELLTRRQAADGRGLRAVPAPVEVPGPPVPVSADGAEPEAGEPPVFVAFDDGFAECWTVARPLLLRHGVPCIFFVTTRVLDNRAVLPRNKVSLCIDAVRRLDPAGRRAAVARVRRDPATPFSGGGAGALVAWLRRLTAADDGAVDRVAGLLGVDFEAYLRDRRPYLTREQVRSMAVEGFTIGAHTVTHTHLRRLPDAAAVEREIVESCEHVRALTGIEPVPFAFPFDSAGVDRALLASIRGRNPVVGPMFDTRGLRADRPFIVPRVWADPPASRAAAGASNLPTLMRTAHVAQVFHLLNRGIRGARA